MNFENGVEKDCRCLYKSGMIHSPMAMYIIQVIIFFGAVLCTWNQQNIQFTLMFSVLFLCTIFSSYQNHTFNDFFGGKI